jgi:hypothetical protein
MNERLRRLGVEKIKKFNDNFDDLYDEYKKKAVDGGYNGELKFEKERGKIIIFVVI